MTDSILSGYDISKYVAACAKRAGVRIEFEDECKPRTDGRTIWLPKMGAYESRENVAKLKNFVRHETSHVTYSDFGVLEKYNPQGLLMFVDNLIEDHRVDYLNDTEFAGDLRLTDEAMGVWQRSMREGFDPAKTGPDAKDVYVPLFLWDSIIRLDVWDMNDVCDFLPAHCNLDVLKNLQKFDKDVRKVREIANAEEGSLAVYELAKRIVEEVFKQDPSSMENPKPEGGEGTGKGKGEGEGKDKAKGEGTPDGEGKGEGEAGKTELRDVDMKGMPSTPYASHGGGGINAANFKTGDEGKTYTPDPPELIREWDFTTGKGRNLVLRREAEGDRLGIAKHMSKSASMANVLRTKLQVYSRDRWEYGKKKGKLHGSQLWRTTMKDAVGYNERVFKQQIKNNNLDVCIQLLVDASGSMSGDKFENAAAAACMLNETLSHVLHIPVEILAFTDLREDGWSGEQRNTMFVLKNFDKHAATQRLINDFGTVSHHLADNVDGESLAYGFNRIRNRKEKRRIMVVLSDGSPCGGHHKGSTATHTRDVIKAIERTPIELMGIGIMYDAVSRWYKHYDTIHDAKSIEPSLIRILDKLLFRG